MIIEFQPPYYVQGHQSLDQVAQSNIQPVLECLQGWGIHNLLGQPVPVCHCPLSKEILLSEGGEALGQVAQRTCGCPIPGGIRGQAGWGFEHPAIERGVPAYSRGIGTG